MKAFGIATLIALSALINESSARWCGCYRKGAGFLGADLWQQTVSNACCEGVTGTGLQDGSSYFGLTGKNWCDISGDEDADRYKKCCGHDNYGYCK